MITPPVHIRLYREKNEPETVDDFVAIYDLQALLGVANPNTTCRVDSGCYFRSSEGCEYDYAANCPNGQEKVTCSMVFDNPTKPAIFILRSDHEKRLLSG